MIHQNPYSLSLIAAGRATASHIRRTQSRRPRSQRRWYMPRPTITGAPCRPLSKAAGRWARADGL